MTRVLRTKLPLAQSQREWSPDVYVTQRNGPPSQFLAIPIAYHPGPLAPPQDKSRKKKATNANQNRDDAAARLHIGVPSVQRGIPRRQCDGLHRRCVFRSSTPNVTPRSTRALLDRFLFPCSPWPAKKRVTTRCRGIKLFLWPGSGVFEAKPKWIVCRRIVENDEAVYARQLAKIQPAWIEATGDHVLNPPYSEPHWSSQGIRCICFNGERCSDFDSSSADESRWRNRFDPIESRNLLIRKRIVRGRVRQQPNSIATTETCSKRSKNFAAKNRRLTPSRRLRVAKRSINRACPIRSATEPARKIRSRMSAPSSIRLAGRCRFWPPGLANPTGPPPLSRCRPHPAKSRTIDCHRREDTKRPNLRPETCSQTSASRIEQDDSRTKLGLRRTRLPLQYSLPTRHAEGRLFTSPSIRRRYPRSVTAR